MKFSAKTIIQSVLLLVLLSLSVATVVLLRQASFFGWQLMIVKSGSMAPAIPTGSVVAVRPQTEYALGEVVTFRDPGNPQVVITHRVAEKGTVNDTPVYYTKGDANSIEDARPVSRDQVVGKVAWSLPWIGYFLAFLQTPLGVMMFIVVPGTLLIYEELRKLHSNIREMFKPASLVVLLVAFATLANGLHSTWAVYVTQAQIQGMTFSTTRWLLPELQAQVAEQKVTAKVISISGFTQLEYQISYQHVVSGQPVQEAVTGSVTKPPEETETALPETYLGTCSANEVCTPHTDVTQLKIEVMLKQLGQPDTSLTKNL